MATDSRTITEKTLVPISLVAVVVGLTVYVSGVASDAREAKAKVELDHAERIKVEDELVERVNEMRSRVYVIDSKLDMLVHGARHDASTEGGRRR